MGERLIEEVYDTLKVVLISQARVEGVENAFEAGGECERAYGRMLDAYERLCQRLGVVDEDDDVEIIIRSLMEIEGILSRKMFAYGVQFAKIVDQT